MSHSSKISKTLQQWRQSESLSIAPFLLPAFILYAVYILYSIVNGLYMSFFRWDGASPTKVFVGLKNYIELFTADQVFMLALRNTAIWTVLNLIFPILLGLGLAVALNQNLKGRSVFRTLFYLPAVIAMIAVATMWEWMYNPSFGIINELLKWAHLETLILPWLGSPKTALYSVFAAYIWVATGPNMILFLAGLQGVPASLIEAAKVDGANVRQVFWHVTLPSIRRTLVIVLTLTIINSLKSFDLIYGMTFGGPAQSTQVLASWSYFQIFNYRYYGKGLAVAMVLLVITLLVIVPYLLWAARDEE